MVQRMALSVVRSKPVPQRASDAIFVAGVPKSSGSYQLQFERVKKNSSKKYKTGPEKVVLWTRKIQDSDTGECDAPCKKYRGHRVWS